MKKNFIYALWGAIALSGAASLTACSSSDEIVDNPNYNPETGAVKTEFTISLPNNVAGKTRMAATDVQVGGYNDFRGLTDIYLLPFAAATNANSTASVNGSTIKLGDITKDVATGNAERLNNSVKNSVVYKDVEIHTGTQSFIFYAKASGEASSRDQADKFKLGSLISSGVTESMTGVNGVSFALEPITNSSAACVGSTKGTALVTLMNEIAGITDNATPAVMWKDVTNASLAGMYATFITIKAGSSKSIEAALGKLYSQLKTYADGADGSAKQIATNIRSKISSACATTPADDATAITLKEDYQGYPADVYLPEGVARINWDVANSQFKGVSSADASSGKFANPNVYTFPASLYYWTNSPLVAADSKKSTEYSTGTTWADVVSTGESGVYKEAASSVSASTRSIALVNQIEYAVGRLDTYVKIAASGTNPVTLKDYEDAIVNIPDGGFKLTGVLVGNQKPVGWNFETSGSPQYTIYDKNVVSGITASSTAESGPNYTLVLETAANEEVTVALEFQNGNQEFKGAEGEIIPANSKFYLLADLKPSTSPDGNADDPTKTSNKVFKQDYMTTAKFTIGENSLKKAYYTLPDLRKPDLELGLSVNLEWKQGITFNVVFQ